MARLCSGVTSTRPVSPGAQGTFTVALPQVKPAPGVEYWLDVSFELKDDQPWAPAGHEVAWAQFKLPLAAPAAAAEPGQGALRLAEANGLVQVTGDGFAVAFNKAAGLLVSLTKDGRELVKEPLRPHFWRAPTDNDRGYGNIDSRLQHLLVDPAWRDARPIVVDSRTDAFSLEGIAVGLLRSGKL